MRLYSDLAGWFHLLTPPADYADEAAEYARLFDESGDGSALTLLELGSGGGNTASHLKHRYECTLTDLSEEMLEVSRSINPECEHIQGDMRTLRLERTFDAVLVHDAVMYMTSRADLRGAVAAAFVHTRPGGVALFVPDYTRETFAERTDHGGHDGEGRSLRFLEWTRDPDPTDTTYEVDYAILLREDGEPARIVHDHHVEGLFSRAEWLSGLEAAGFVASAVPLDIEPDFPEYAAFMGRRTIH